MPGWFDKMAQTEQQPRAVMGVDYQIYADGEALLGWLNATVRFTFEQATNVNALVQDLAEAVHRRLEVEAVEIAHLKMTFDPNHPFGELAAINLVRNDYVPELSHKVVEQGLYGVTEDGMEGIVEHIESFWFGKPFPTHREESTV